MNTFQSLTLSTKVCLRRIMFLIGLCFSIHSIGWTQQLEIKKSQVDFSYFNSFPEFNLLQYSNSSDPEAEHKSLSTRLLEPFQKHTGMAFAGSLVLPGFSQAANGKWLRAGLYLLAEVGIIVAHQAYLDRGRDGEQVYRNFIDQHWSVEKYTQYVIDYNNRFNPKYQGDPLDIREFVTSAGYNPNQMAFGRSSWFIDLNKLRDLENETKYQKNSWNTSSTSFSHPLPNYGSQQYYELVAKYLQFGPGWRDFAVSVEDINWTIQDMSAMFLDASAQSKDFNDHLRTASRLTSLLLLNHVFSAFDAYFTVKLKNYQLNTNRADVRMVTGAAIQIPF